MLIVFEWNVLASLQDALNPSAGFPGVSADLNPWLISANPYRIDFGSPPFAF